MPVTRDTWFSASRGERDANLGGADRLKTKGIQEFALVDLDTARLRGRVIQSATLHLHSRSDTPQRRLSISTLATDWVEGRSTRYARQAGAASFDWAAQDQKTWAWPGSDVTAVMNGQGNTLWRFAEATLPDAGGWQTVAVDPAVVAARVAGISYGFVVFDDVGSEYRRDGDAVTFQRFPNRYVSSREAGAAQAPYFTVALGAEDRLPPAAPEGFGTDTAGLPPGEATVRWVTPADEGPAGTLGFQARIFRPGALEWDSGVPVPQYLVPLAGKTGGTVSMHLRDLGLPPGVRFALGVRAVDAAGNPGPVATTGVALAGSGPALVLPKPPRSTPATPGSLPRAGTTEVFVVDPLDKVDPVSGVMQPARTEAYRRGNHLWSAEDATVHLFAARGETVAFQVVLLGPAEGVAAEARFEGLGGGAPLVEFFTVVYVDAAGRLVADPLLPWAGSGSNSGRNPLPASVVPGARYASFLVDVHVPKATPPGEHPGRLVLRTAEGAVELALRLRVWDFSLPDRLSFIPQMNGYGRVPEAEHELDYYRLAQRHRTCLNILPYGWTGRIADDRAPVWDGRDFDWTAYDRRFGPLLDGSAFADLPRGAVPVEAFYLPLNENWPADIHSGFRGGYWIEEALTPAYWKEFVGATRQFAGHLREKRWRDTMFEFYLNNKISHKKNKWNGSSAPWIFDEPMNTQDFWALRWYGLMFHHGVGRAREEVQLLFRADISRPQWQRDILDGVLDVNVVGGAFRRYERVVLDRKERWGEVAYNYGSANSLEEGNAQPAAWCVDTWCRGLDGVVPWQTLGKPRSWKGADPNALFYPGTEIGRPGPKPSLRLKAFRRGQQDVEYLTRLAAASGLSRRVVGERVLRELKLNGTFSQADDEDAGSVRFQDLDPVALWELRTRVGAWLDRHPVTDRDRWVEFRAPKWDLDDLPALGLVRSVSP
ncbi:MAG: DUF4091 domain-containing protein [Deferrisomatales bacterium]|nr:DUF4091 domain-containing protein [Deferrisomatales bacterium]